jgi:dihydrofolate reductase
MEFDLIVAMNHNGLIGIDNKIPWYIPEDLTHFSKITKDSIIIMGRKTYDSLPTGPLRNRINIVLSREPRVTMDRNLIFTNSDSIFSILKHYPPDMKVFVIGGSDIYKLFFHMCNKLYITTVFNDFEDKSEDKSYFPHNMECINNYYDKIEESELFHSKIENTPYRFSLFQRKSV